MLVLNTSDINSVMYYIENMLENMFVMYYREYVVLKTNYINSVMYYREYVGSKDK